MSHLNGQEHEKSRKRLRLIYSSPDRESTAGQSVTRVSLPASRAPLLTPIGQVPVHMSTSHAPHEITAASQNLSSLQFSGGLNSKKTSELLTDDGKEVYFQYDEQRAPISTSTLSQSPPQSFMDVTDDAFHDDKRVTQDVPSSLQWFTSSSFYIPRTPLFATPEVCTC